ncbi:MAG: hypothetical protein WKG07_32235 [Hymenobacter sp.]
MTASMAWPPGVGTRNKYNTSLTLNYRKGKLNAFGSYDFRQDQRFTNGSLEQATTGPVPDPVTGQPGTAPHILYLSQRRDGQNYPNLARRAPGPGIRPTPRPDADADRPAALQHVPE